MSLQPMTRRSALSGAAAIAAGAVAGFLLSRNSTAARAAAPGTAANAYGPATQTAAVLATVSEVGSTGVVAHGVVLTRDSSGTVHGVSATCTHQGCTVGAPQDGVVSCPCHGSRFDAATGKVLRGPATRPLPAVPVHVQGDQVVRG